MYDSTSSGLSNEESSSPKSPLKDFMPKGALAELEEAIQRCKVDKDRLPRIIDEEMKKMLRTGFPSDEAYESFCSTYDQGIKEIKERLYAKYTSILNKRERRSQTLQAELV